MKRFISLFVLILITASTTSAQAPSDTLRNSLTKGAKAIQFSVLSNFTLGSFSGSTFSGKWQLSDRRAIRVGFSISGSIQNLDINTLSESRNSIGDETTSNEGETVDDSDFSVSLNGHFMSYPNPGDRINFYTGIGPILRWRTGTREEEIVTNSSNTPIVNTRTETVDESLFVGGLGFIVGVEWFINSRISLTSEYGIIASYLIDSTDRGSMDGRSDGLTERNAEVEESEDRFSLSGDGVRFGLSVYF